MELGDTGKIDTKTYRQKTKSYSKVLVFGLKEQEVIFSRGQYCTFRFILVTWIQKIFRQTEVWSCKQ